MNRQSRLRHHFPRRGYTLIELLIVMSMSVAVTGGSVVCISTVLKSERSSAAAVHESLVIARLRQVWSDDVHQTQESKFGSGDQGETSQCQLTLRDGRLVQYRSTNRGIMREAQRNQVIEKRDVFQFPEGTRFEIQQIDESRLARLTVIHPTIDLSAIASSSPHVALSAPRGAVMTFDAALGREARLLEALQKPSEAK